MEIKIKRYRKSKSNATKNHETKKENEITNEYTKENKNEN
jgi:hypothetical protein